MSVDPLSLFSAPVRDWFARAFGDPTPPQAHGWPAIASGRSTLISAPTGSGKTLAAFLWAIDRLLEEKSRPAASGLNKSRPSASGRPGSWQDEERTTRVVYVSPLKALGYDIERNLRVPLTAIEGADALRIGIRTGDTAQRERQALVRKPPDILITTPESLYLMLTSRARETLAQVDCVIVDEIHAVAASKRGSHLALTLERLEALRRQAVGAIAGGTAATDLDEPGRLLADDRPVLQRIGLSATQRPLDEIARFLGGVEQPQGRSRPVTIVDAPVDKPLDLEVVVPVADLRDPETDPMPPGETLVTGDGASRRSIWPSIYPRVLELVHAHASTIVFVNNRRLAERLALRLNELADEEIARSHHGSLSREARTEIEEQLKKGQLRCLVATSSLELGIDMGAVDLVIQIESPKSVARGLQRIGRAGHTLSAVSKGRIFPKFRADLVECAVVAKRMRERAIEATAIPRNALDVLAQQIVAMIALEDWDLSDLHRLVTSAYPYAELPRTQLENVLDMLDGRYPSEEFAELRPRLAWDRVDGTLRARRGSQKLAVTNAGTIPDRGLFGVHLPDGRRVGELDEEMVYEARAGQAFRLGSTTWRIEEITRDRVIVTPAPEVPGAIPFWKGEGIGRPYELGAAIGAFQREVSELGQEQAVELLEREYSLDRFAAENLWRYLSEQRQATRVVPSDRAIVVERFRDEIGDWRLCVLTPFGGRVHAAWAMAIAAKLRDERGLDPDAIWSDDGVILHLPDADESPPVDVVLLDPQEIEELVTGELAGTALFGSRFREAAARALLIPGRGPDRRTPLWQQRLKAQGLLQVARRYAEFPIVLEAYREVLSDWLDLPALKGVLSKLERRELALVEAETPLASPFAQSLLFDYIATYMYEGDTPRAEQRAAALALDRDLLRELLGAEELRELIDPVALATVESELQALSGRKLAADADQAHDLLRTLGDLSDSELQARVVAGIDARSLVERLVTERRVARLRLAGEQRWIAAQDAGLYRDAVGAVPPAGLPEAYLEPVEDALARLVRRYARTHGPFTTAELAARYELARADLEPLLTRLEEAEELVRGELRPDGREREWCDPDVLRRLRRASIAALRHEIEPTEQAALARFAISWHGIDRYARRGEVVGVGRGTAPGMPLEAGPDRLREVLAPLQGVALAPEVWERDVLPRRLGAYDPRWLDHLCAAGELVWIGAGASAGRGGRVALYFREDVPFLGPPAGAPPDGPADAAHGAVRERLRAGAAFWSDLLSDLDQPPAEARDALWDLVWAGEVTNDAFAPLRARALSLAPPGPTRRRRRFGARRAGPLPQVQGRWSLTAPLLGEPGSPSEKERAMALAELLLERHGIVTRETVVSERVPRGFASVYGELAALETVGTARRGYFVEGLGGAQFALPAAVERLRSHRADTEQAVVLAAQDPANVYGAALPWPKRATGRRPARVPGAYVVTLGGRAVLYVEAGGRGLVPLADPDPQWLRPALAALAAHVRDGALKRLAIERFDGEPVIGSPVEPLLEELGFRSGPRRLILSA